MIFAFWLAIAIGLTVSRFFVTGELDNSPSSLYKDAAHLLFGGAFVYACFLTNDSLVREIGVNGQLDYDPFKVAASMALWALLAIAVVAEIAFALRDNF